MQNYAAIRPDLEAQEKTDSPHYDYTTVVDEIPKEQDFTGCKTSCCMVGFSAYYGIGDIKPYIYGHGDDKFKFYRYSTATLISEKTIISAESTKDGKTRVNIMLWEFVFGYSWDNNYDEAIARLTLVVDNRIDDIKLIFNEHYDKYQLDFTAKYAKYAK
jgi:hypothetical protein